MGTTARDCDTRDLDGLRLLALGRIPRCGRCPRFRALVAAHDGGSVTPGALPAVPEGCTHQVCAPLAARYSPRATRRHEERRPLVAVRASL